VSEGKKEISIWFMAGIILSVYGLTITISGVYYLLNPLEVFAAELHLDLLWGVLMTAAGALFLWKQRPSRAAS
jgi:hypothetical protein